MVPSRRFLRRLKKLDPVLKKRTLEAVKKLKEDHRRKGVHLEPVSGQEGAYTARVDRNYRLTLLEEYDEQGVYFVLDNVVTHQRAYRRK